MGDPAEAEIDTIGGWLNHPKLDVGQVNDPCGQEAGTVARHVTGLLASRQAVGSGQAAGAPSALPPKGARPDDHPAAR